MKTSRNWSGVSALPTGSGASYADRQPNSAQQRLLSRALGGSCYRATVHSVARFYLERIRENAQQRLVMEQRLMEREELFRQMTETVDEAFWAATPDGNKLIYISPAHKKITGLAGRDIHTTLLNGVHPKDEAKLSLALRSIRQEKKDFEVVYRIHHVDGVWRWLRTKGFPVLDEHGEVVRMVGFSEDITERKLADQALREPKPIYATFSSSRLTLL